MSVYEFRGRTYLATRDVMGISTPPLYSASAAAADAAIGAWLRGALGADAEPSGNPDAAIRLILAACDLRSWKAFTNQSKFVDVSAGDGDLTLYSSERERSGAYAFLPDPLRLVNPSDAEFGAALRGAFQRSRPA